MGSSVSAIIRVKNILLGSSSYFHTTIQCHSIFEFSGLQPVGIGRGGQEVKWCDAEIINSNRPFDLSKKAFKETYIPLS